MTRSRLALLLLAALVVVAGCGSSGHKTAAPTSGTVIVNGTVAGRDGIYAVQPDGSGLTRLDLGVPSEDDVYVNPAGTTALVVLYGNGTSDTAYLENLATRKQRQLVIPGLYGVSLPAQPWSPDGKQLLLMHGFDNPRAEIYTVKTGYLRPLGIGDYDSPVWSGDGRSVIFADRHSIYSVPARAGVRTRLATFRHITPMDPQLSADGKWIAFENSTEEAPVYVTRADGTHIRTLPDAIEATWSPSGAHLAWQGYAKAGSYDPATGKGSSVPNTLDTRADPPLWSPDGKWILFERSDLPRAPSYEHLQLWAMRPNGTAAHALTRAFPTDAGFWRDATWVAGTVAGKPVPPAPLVAVRPTATETSDFPIVALSASGTRAAVAQGYGFSTFIGPRDQPKSGGPLGPILMWDEATDAAASMPVHGCAHVPTVVLARRLAYVCDNSQDDVLKQSLRYGSATLAHAAGGQGIGTFLAGTVTDGRRFLYATEVNVEPKPTQRPAPPVVRIYEADASGPRLLRRIDEWTQLQAVDGRRVVISTGGKQSHLFVLVGEIWHGYTVPGRILGAALDGNRIVVATANALSVFNLRNRKGGPWKTEPETAFVGAQGDLAVYLTGAGIHVMSLTNGREIVLDLGPNATGPALAAFGSGGLFYSYDEAYSTHPGRLAFVPLSALDRAISAHGRLAR